MLLAAITNAACRLHAAGPLFAPAGLLQQVCQCRGLRGEGEPLPWAEQQRGPLLAHARQATRSKGWFDGTAEKSASCGGPRTFCLSVAPLGVRVAGVVAMISGCIGMHVEGAERAKIRGWGRRAAQRNS